MVVQIPVVLYSGGFYPRGFRTLEANDTVPGTDTTAQASGNAALVSASNKVPISGGYMTGQLFAASGVVVSGTLSRNGYNVVTVGDVETVTSTMIASGTIIDADVNISGAINATKLNFLQAGASAVARTVDSKLKDVVSVKDFGAVGDGVTDDTLALQASLSYCQGTGSGAILYIPTGTYCFSESSQVQPYPSGYGLYSGLPITIIGAGVEKTILKNTSATGAGLRLAGGFSYVSDFTINNNQGSGIAFRQGGQHTNTKRLYIKNQTGNEYALVVDGSTLAHLEDIIISNCSNGIALGQTNPTNYVTLEQVTIGDYTGTGLYCNLGSNIRINGLTIETGDVNYSHLAFFQNSFNITLVNFTSENSQTALLTADEYVKISDCKNINFLSFYANVHGTNNKPYFGVRATASQATSSVLIENGVYLADNASTLIKTSQNTISSLIARNIYTNSASASFSGIDNTSVVIAESVENWVNYGNSPTHSLNSTKLNCLNLLEDISLSLSSPSSQIVLTNCTGVVSGAGAAVATRIGGGSPRQIVRARTTATFSLANNTLTRIVFDVEDYDTGGIYNPASGFIVVTRAGYYDIKAKAGIITGANDCVLQIAIYKNGSLFTASYTQNNGPSGAAGDLFVTIADIVYADVGDSLAIYLYQYDFTATAAKTVYAGAFFCANPIS